MQRLWVVLVVISSAVALWFSAQAASALWNYSRLDSTAIAQIEQWGVAPISSSEFAIEAKYFFLSKKGERFFGKTIFKKPYFLNEPSARATIKGLKNRSWTVWYNSKNPTISSLQKIFPFQACIQAFLTVVVTLYFVVIRGYLIRLRS